MKHAWLLNHYAQEPGHAGGTRHYGIGRYLPNFGWQFSIVAASVELNTGRQRLADGEITREAEFDGVPFLWVRTPRYSGNGPGRILNMFAYTFRVLLPSTTRDLPRPDVIVGSSVHPLAAWAGSRLARRLNVPFVFEVRDLWPQTLIDLGRLQDAGMLTRLLRRLELILYRAASQIIVLMPRASDYIAPLGIPRSTIRWIPNGVNLHGNVATTPQQSPDGFTLMYFGAHGTANGLDTVLIAMQEVQRHAVRIRLRLIGDGPKKDSLQELSRKLGLENISFEEPVSKEEIPALAAEADAFVFNLVDAPVYRYGISPNKIFDFMAAARPIIFCGQAINNPVAESGAGVSVPPGNPADLAKAMIAMSELPLTERIEMGNAGRNYVSLRHDYRVLAKAYSDVLDTAADAHSGD